MLDIIKTAALRPVLGYPFFAGVGKGSVKLFAVIHPQNETLIGVAHYATGAIVSRFSGSNAKTERGVVAAARREVAALGGVEGFVREIASLNALPVLNP